MENILYWCAALISFAGAVTIIIKVVKFLNEYHDRMQKYDSYQEQIDNLHTETDAKMQQLLSEQYILTESMLAVLEGLKQQGCNGPVTRAKDKLEKHLNQQAHGGI